MDPYEELPDDARLDPNMIFQGWRRCDWPWWDDDGYRQWVNKFLPQDEYWAAQDRIKETGLPARMSVKSNPWDESFLRIELEPQEGWTWLTTPKATEYHYNGEWKPHISLTHGNEYDSETAQKIFDLYNGNVKIIKISRFGSGGTAGLADDDEITLDENVQKIFMTGDAHKGMGLHISL
jgi:hypothetical protein